jgi:hypothetical protein
MASVADGAGSARFSDKGSAIACNAIVEQAASYFELGGRLENLQREDALRWCDAARARIEEEAAARECDVRDLATTLCAAIVAPTCSCFFQIGDGAIVLRHHNVYGVVFWPQTGEYANSTNFLTSHEYHKQLEFLTTPTRCSDIALLTDGLERLALRFDSQTPHAPFFDPFFSALRAAEDYSVLNQGLLKFLGDQSVRNRSNDDTTLILASHIHDGLEDSA